MQFISQFIYFVTFFELIFSHYYARYFGNNVIPYNIFANTCIALYFFFYYYHINKVGRGKTLLVVFLIWSIFWCSRILKYSDTNSDSLSYIFGMFVVLYAMIEYFKYIIDLNLTTNEILKLPQFYFTIGIITFFTSCFPILSLSNLLILSDDVADSYQSILQVGNIFLSLGYLGAILCTPKEAPSIASS